MCGNTTVKLAKCRTVVVSLPKQARAQASARVALRQAQGDTAVKI